MSTKITKPITPIKIINQNTIQSKNTRISQSTDSETNDVFNYDWTEVVSPKSHKRRNSSKQSPSSKTTKTTTNAQFSSHNKFNVLSQNEDTDMENNEINEIVPKLPPPIFIKSRIQNDQVFCAKIKNMIEPADDFTCKSSTESLKLNTTSPNAYRTIIRYLKESKVEFFTYQLKENKPYRIVIRNLHSTTDPNYIKEELEKEGFQARNVTNALHRVSKIQLPLFFVDLEPAQELRNTENDIQPVYSDIKLWRKSMYDKRRKNMQKIPKSLEEAITQLFDGRENITTNTGELFCHTEETSSPVIFTCKTNLELLSQSSHIFADGTFSYAPKYLLILLVRHSATKIIIIMSNKRKEDSILSYFQKKIKPLPESNVPLPQRDTDVAVENNCDQYDIGHYIKNNLNINEDFKYKLLKNPWVPSIHYNFKKDIVVGNRAFLFKWFSIYPWLAYSKIFKGTFCLYCVLFQTHVSHGGFQGQFINKPFQRYQKFLEKANNYSKTQWHIESSIRFNDFINMTSKNSSVHQMINTNYKNKIDANRKKLIPILSSLIFLTVHKMRC
ncbi:hypothetical protein QTP88_013462 [Uroleucon formosanum]